MLRGSHKWFYGNSGVKIHLGHLKMFKIKLLKNSCGVNIKWLLLKIMNYWLTWKFVFRHSVVFTKCLHVVWEKTLDLFGWLLLSCLESSVLERKIHINKSIEKAQKQCVSLPSNFYHLIVIVLEIFTSPSMSTIK